MIIILRQLGVSLLELLIAISIVIALTLISIPLFTSFIKNYRLTGTANDLFYHLQYAKTQAVKLNTNVYVSFSTGSTWCYGINSGSACNCTIANNCNLGMVSYASANQLSLSVSGFASNNIIFEPIHGAANSTGTVTFTLYGVSSPLITTTVSRYGSITVCSTGLSGYIAC